jgi:GxxExxY protein
MKGMKKLQEARAVQLPTIAEFSMPGWDRREISVFAGRWLAPGLAMTTLVTSQSAELVIASAISVHRALGPGLLESAYERCLGYEFVKRDVCFEPQVALPVKYDDHLIDCGYRMDFVVDRQLIVEVKSVERILPIHHAQVLTYLKLSGYRQALLLNFNVRWMRDGIKSFLQGPSPFEGDAFDDDDVSPPRA